MTRGSYQRIPPRTASVVLRALFDAMRERDIHFIDVATTLGLTTTTLSYWKSGRSTPGISDVEAFAQAIGYELVLRPKQE